MKRFAQIVVLLLALATTLSAPVALASGTDPGPICPISGCK